MVFVQMRPQEVQLLLPARLKVVGLIIRNGSIGLKMCGSWPRAVFLTPEEGNTAVLESP